MQEWKKELCREQPETLQELGKGTYIQRRNITPYERKDGNGEADKGYSCEYRILTKEEYFAALEQENSNKNTVNKILLFIIILFYSLFQFVYLFIRRNKKAESFIDKIIYLKLYFLPIKKELYRDLFPNSSFTNA